MIKKATAFLAAAAVGVAMCLPVSAAAPVKSDISAKASVLIEADSGRVIWGKNENTRLPMASTTKIMTTVLALESGDLDSEFIVDSTAVHTEGSSMGLKEGDIVSKRDLCIGMLLPSGNDAANCAAAKLAGDNAAFSKLMNAKAAELGLDSTHFVTPSGLHDPNHYSTARDMGILACYALKNEDFADICSSSSMVLDFGNPPYSRSLNNTNKLLRLYEGCIGVKTGFTDEAGRCLVSAASRNGVTLVCVTLNASDDWNDHTKLLDYGFSVTQRAVYSEEISYSAALAGGKDDSLLCVGSKPFEYTRIKGKNEKISYKIIASPVLYAPVRAGEQTGEIIYYIDEKEICRIPLVSAAYAKKSDAAAQVSLWDRVTDRITDFIAGFMG